MTPEALAAGVLALAAIPLLLSLSNLALYRRTLKVAAAQPREGSDSLPKVSVLIPARNEERSIARAVEAARSNLGVDLEIVVMDDHSQDATAAIVNDIARDDPRVRLEAAPPLPRGWCGKQHACAALAKASRHDILVFVDADVTLADTALRRLVAALDRSGADLISGIPRQRTGTLAEHLVIPIIHFILLGFLPMIGMRLTRHPAFAAGCGQLFVARKQAYEKAGGHAAIKASRHDGVTLPRAFRRAGCKTDLFDATDVAECRMYRSAGELWQGLAKNATEGMAAPAAILPWTVLLICGQVLPVLLLGWAWWTDASPDLVRVLAAALLLSYLNRFLLAWRFRQSLLGAVLHPLGILVVVAIQWFALTRSLMGMPLAWKERF